jgi:hypothetical protein
MGHGRFECPTLASKILAHPVTLQANYQRANARTREQKKPMSRTKRRPDLSKYAHLLLDNDLDAIEAEIKEFERTHDSNGKPLRWRMSEVERARRLRQNARDVVMDASCDDIIAIEELGMIVGDF